MTDMSLHIAPKSEQLNADDLIAGPRTITITSVSASLHGLRKLAVVQLAEAGCSDAEIQAVTGQSPEMVAFYRKDASARALSKVAQTRRNEP